VLLAFSLMVDAFSSHLLQTECRPVRYTRKNGVNRSDEVPACIAWRKKARTGSALTQQAFMKSQTGEYLCTPRSLYLSLSSSMYLRRSGCFRAEPLMLVDQTWKVPAALTFSNDQPLGPH
jgi:hypothetical protein